MKNLPYCAVCHLVVATGDPHRLERGGRTAHEGCVKKTAYPSIRNEAEEILGLADDKTILVNFRAGLGRSGGLRQFAKLLSWQLGRAAANCVNGRSGRRESIAAFALKASDAIYCDVTVDRVAAPRAAL
jgi:hypothetical protein